MQLFRFTAALILVVTISLVGISLEKCNLAMQRAISLQQYRTDQLLERRAHLRLQINELTSPLRRNEHSSQRPADVAADTLPTLR